MALNHFSARHFGAVSLTTLRGGGGIIACQSTVSAAPDGYTLMQGYVATHGTSPATRTVPYDAIKDFTPIGMIGGTPNVLVVGPSVSATTFKAFLDFLHKGTEGTSYGSAGQGSLTHLTTMRGCSTCCFFLDVTSAFDAVVRDFVVSFRVFGPLLPPFLAYKTISSFSKK